MINHDTVVRSPRRFASLRFLPGLTAAIVLALGCGGSQKTKSGLGDDSPPPPPPATATGQNGDKPERTISRDARKDYTAAVEFYQAKAKEGWNDNACSASARKFAGVASEHSKLVEARYMAGLSYHHCWMAEEAEAEYQKVLQLDANHGPALSNLGELYFKAGKAKLARQYWAKAKERDPKNVAARNNLAYLALVQMRETRDRRRWTQIEEEAKLDLSSALAVDNDNVKTYVLYGLIYLEGSERNKSRLDLAKLLLDEGEKRDANYAPLHNARGLLQMRRDNLGEALKAFRKAVDLDAKFVEARMNVGNITLGFRKYDTAKEQFDAVLRLTPKDYDAHIGLGVAKRGLGDLDGAKASYQAAKKLDANRGEAYFNLGVLYKDFYANSAGDLNASIDAYKEARKFFRQFVTKKGVSKADQKEAEDNIADCDKIIPQLQQVIQQMKQQPQPGGTP